MIRTKGTHFERLGGNGLNDLNRLKGSAAIDRKRARSIDFVEGEYLAGKTRWRVMKCRKTKLGAGLRRRARIKNCWMIYRARGRGPEAARCSDATGTQCVCRRISKIFPWPSEYYRKTWLRSATAKDVRVCWAFAVRTGWRRWSTARCGKMVSCAPTTAGN